MTQEGVREYVEAIKERHGGATRKVKGRILDEAERVTGYHRKALIRLLGGRGESATSVSQRRGRPRHYGPEVAEALRVVWEASGRICSRRLHPFLGELAEALKRHGEQRLEPGVETQLRSLSPATIDRLLRPVRLAGVHRRLSTTKPGSLLKSSIPIRTFADWNEDRPGFVEVNLVAHCGETTEGFYLNTLNTVDVATGWIECEPVWGKGQDRVGSAVHHIRQRLPLSHAGAGL